MCLWQCRQSISCSSWPTEVGIGARINNTERTTHADRRLTDCYQISSRGAIVFCTPRNVRSIILVSYLIWLFFISFCTGCCSYLPRGKCSSAAIFGLLTFDWTMLEISKNLGQECMCLLNPSNYSHLRLVPSFTSNVIPIVIYNSDSILSIKYEKKSEMTMSCLQ